MNPRTSSATRTLAASRSRRVWPVRVLGAAAVVSVLVALVAGGVLLVHELHSSRLQARAISRHAAQLDYARVAGHSDAVRYPVHGPFDQRLGYTELPRFSERLHARGFALTGQTRFSQNLLDYVDQGFSPPYAEKTRAGFDVRDCRGAALYDFRYPERAYADFAAVPAVVAQTLLFIENRDLLDESRPTLNPAVDWLRFARAAAAQVGRVFKADMDAPGASTLATQIEKYRHSPDGITFDAREKLRQMVSASVRAYRDGENTLPARRRLVLDYLNTVPLSAAPGKGSTAVRARLAGMLGTSLYSLDRLDAEVHSTLHSDLQQAVGTYLNRLSDPDFARSQGLLGERMLVPASLGAVRYSFTLVERTPGGNRVRVQTDTTDQPLDINEGSKLELGSTAKLRVLTTYLEIVAEVHGRLAVLDLPALRRVEVARQDRLTRWVIDHLATTSDRSLSTLLEAALERRFSASPGESFFTGGGVHTFGNFNASDDGREPTLREALRASINLPFVRLMREIVRHTMYQVPGSTARLLEDNQDPRRVEYLARFADREGQAFLRRFWRKYQNRSAEEMRSMLLDGLRPGADRLAAVFRYLEPEAPSAALAAFLGRRLGDGQLSEARIGQLYARHAPDAFDLPDRGYVARVHPLELWLVAFRLQHPDASLADAVAASEKERQEVYRWLFRTRAKGAQDSRIFTLLEVEAFLDIHRRWARLGYPFGHLVPSLATALGSSGDRPAALAELMGIIVNDGVRLPTLRIDRLRFAMATPYETAFAVRAGAGEQVMAPEVAAALRGALSDVVESGTARRLAGSFRLADGTELTLGGKTGTGDNRIVIGGRAGTALNRTATFVFYLGPRHFGVLTAYVIGADAAAHRFTSALPVQILKSMATALLPQLEAGADKACPALEELMPAGGQAAPVNGDLAAGDLVAREEAVARDEVVAGGEVAARDAAPLPRLRMGRIDGGAASAVPLPAVPVPPDSAPERVPAESVERHPPAE